MDCQQARDRIQHDRLDDQVEAHLDACVDCSRFAAEQAGLSALAEPAPSDLEDLRAGVRGALQQERGPLAWLRSRPTPVRVVLGLVAALGLPLLAGWLLLRVDMAVYPPLRWGAIALALCAAGGIAVGAGLRPLWRPTRARRAALVALAGSLLVLVIAVLPSAHAAHPISLMGTGDDLWSKALGCLSYGLLVAAPGVVLLRLLDRSDRPWLGHGALLAAVAGGVAGNLSLHLHCPLVSPVHLILGHASVLAVLLVLPLGTWIASRAGTTAR